MSATNNPVRCPNCNCTLSAVTYLSVPTTERKDEWEDYHCLQCGNIFLTATDATRCPACDSPRVRPTVEYAWACGGY